jgi:hypothetical protein
MNATRKIIEHKTIVSRRNPRPQQRGTPRAWQLSKTSSSRGIIRE